MSGAKSQPASLISDSRSGLLQDADRIGSSSISLYRFQKDSPAVRMPSRFHNSCLWEDELEP